MSTVNMISSNIYMVKCYAQKFGFTALKYAILQRSDEKMRVDKKQHYANNTCKNATRPIVYKQT